MQEILITKIIALPGIILPLLCHLFSNYLLTDRNVLHIENQKDIIPLINRVVIAEPQHNDAVNLKISIFCFQNGTFKSLLCHLFIPTAVIFLLFYLPLELPFFCC